MSKEEIEQIVEDAIDKIWLPFEFKFIEWESDYLLKYCPDQFWERKDVNINLKKWKDE